MTLFYQNFSGLEVLPQPCVTPCDTCSSLNRRTMFWGIDAIILGLEELPTWLPAGLTDGDLQLFVVQSTGRNRLGSRAEPAAFICGRQHKSIYRRSRASPRWWHMAAGGDWRDLQGSSMRAPPAPASCRWVKRYQEIRTNSWLRLGLASWLLEPVEEILCLWKHLKEQK